MTKVSETNKFLVVFLEKSRLDVIAEKKRLILEKNAKKTFGSFAKLINFKRIKTLSGTECKKSRL